MLDNKNFHSSQSPQIFLMKINSPGASKIAISKGFFKISIKFAANQKHRCNHMRYELEKTFKNSKQAPGNKTLNEGLKSFNEAM